MKGFFPLLLIVAVAFLARPVQAISLTDFNIQKNEPDTNSASVVLYINAVDGNKMRFSCDNTTYASWNDYSSTFSFNLETGPGCSAGDGQKTVYIKAQDESSNEASGSDSIWLDTNAPTIEYTKHDANATDANYVLTTIDSFIVRVKGEKDCNAHALISGLPDQNLFDDGAHNDLDANDGVYGNSFDITSFGKSTSGFVYVVGKLVDGVGNESTKNSFNKISIDVNAPTYSSERPKNYVNDTTPDINARLLDAQSGIYPNTIKMWVDGNKIVPALLETAAVSNGFLVSYTPQSALTGTDVSVGIHFTDKAGIATDVNWAFTIDQNAPNAVNDLNANTISGDNDLNISWGAVTDTGGSGLSHYILYRYTATISSSNLPSATVVSSPIPGSATSHRDSMGASNEDITYYYNVKAVDFAGNISALSNSASRLVPDLNAPSDINFFIPWYSDYEFPVITISGSDVSSAILSCNDVNYSSRFTDLEITDFSITTGNGCTDADGNKTVYAYVFDNHDNNASATRNVYLDRNKPNTPSITETSYSDGNNTIKWGAVSDVGAGIKNYRIYTGTESGVTTSNSCAQTTDLNYTHRLWTSNRYCYRVAAVDLAGNVSELSEEECQTGDSEDFYITISLSGFVERNGKKYYKDGNHSLEVSGNYPLKDVSGKILYSDGNSAGFSLSGTGSAFGGTVLLNAIDGNARLVVDANDSLGLSDSADFNFFIDSAPPEILSISLTQLSETSMKISASASPDTVSMEFFDVNGSRLVPVKGFSGGFNKAEFDWNFSAERSDVNIVARAFDDLNNFSQKNSVKKILKSAGEKLRAIEEIRKSISATAGLLGGFLITPDEELLGKITQAESHLEKARQFLNENAVESMESELSKASALLSEIEEQRPKVGVLNSQFINYAEEKSSFGEELSFHLGGQALSEAQALWKKLEFSREIQSIEITQRGKAEQQVFVILTIRNASGAEMGGFSIIELVPKELSNSAGELGFNTLVETLKEDPVLLVPVAGLSPGEEKSLKYRVKRNFSEKEIKEIENKAYGLFEVPVPLPESADPASVSFRGRASGGIPMPLIITIIVCLGAYLAWRLRRETA